MVKDSDLDREYQRAVRAAQAYDAVHAPAVRASWDANERKVRVDLVNGCVFMFPTDLAQGLGEASDEQLAEVEIFPSGHTLHWEALDVDLGIPELMAGVFGTRAWMAELGRRGGSATSPAKARAARRNGRKGGRPRKKSGR
jgi:hypothetical protein